jgi:ankyrin repeat protein
VTGGRRFRRATIGAVALVLATSLGAGAEDDRTLHELAARGDEARLARAIAAGADVDEPDEQGRTPLHVAAAESRLFAVMALIARGSDPNARDLQRRTPLHLAADGDPAREGERMQIVKLLLAKGADPKARDASGRTPAECAKDDEFVRALAP